MGKCQSKQGSSHFNSSVSLLLLSQFLLILCRDLLRQVDANQCGWNCPFYIWKNPSVGSLENARRLTPSSMALPRQVAWGSIKHTVVNGRIPTRITWIQRIQLWEPVQGEGFIQTHISDVIFGVQNRMNEELRGWRYCPSQLLLLHPIC